jgi:hypothetical protein
MLESVHHGAARVTGRLTETLRREQDDYRGSDERPLAASDFLQLGYAAAVHAVDG